MERSLKHAFVVAGVLLTSLSGASLGVEPALGSEEEVLLQVHLPREVTVRGNRLDLSQVCVIRGRGPVVAKARTIAMGRLSAPGQKIVLDRPTILSRLASSGISSEQVRLTGAESVTVRKQLRIVKAEDFVVLGQEFLKKHPAARSASQSVPIAKPKDLILSQEIKDIEFTPRFISNRARGHVSVLVDVMADGVKVATREVTFRLKYQVRQVVTTEPIAEGAILTAQNAEVKTVVSDQPEPAGWKPPYGLAATRSLPAAAVIAKGMIGMPREPVVVRRNQSVVIRLERPGLLITATGMALQEARTGEFVKVRNTDSQRVIVCKVIGQGMVEPML